MRGRHRSRRTLRGFDGGEFSTSLCAGGVHKVSHTFRGLCRDKRVPPNECRDGTLHVSQLIEAQTVPHRVGSALTGEGVGGVAPWSKLGGLLSQ